MNEARRIHRKAMDAADLAYAAKIYGTLEDFAKYSLEAFELELEAAELFKDDFSAEPTRSVLYRSAASLAIDCKKFVQALELIETGLSGKPRADIAQELEELKQTVLAHLEKEHKTTATFGTVGN